MKKLLFLFLVFLANLSVHAQSEDISSVFISMPDDFFMGLDTGLRTELIASPDSANITVETQIGGEIKRVALTNDYIALKTSNIGTLEIKLLPLVNNSNIIAVVNTVCGPACDSNIDFYTTSWASLPQGDLFPVKDKNWFLSKKADIDNNVLDNISAILDMNPIKLSLSPDNTDIKAEYDIQKYLSSDDYKTISPLLLKDPLVFKWDKLSYKR